MSALQPFEEGQQSVIGLMPTRRSLWWRCLVERRLLYRQVGVQIDLRCFDRLVSKP